MNTATKVTGFVAGLAAVFGITLGIGNAVGQVSEPAASHDAEHGAGHQAEAAESGATNAEGTADLPGGLMVSQNGYTLRLADQHAQPGSKVGVAFTITGPDGQPVTAYEVEHEKQLHLIAVRRDFTGFQHVHPELDSNGTWTTRLDLTAGLWRLFADFKATNAEPLTLGADLSVAGPYQPATLPTETRTAKVDGYTVTLEGDLQAGADAELTLSVSRDGEPVTDLEPYLGAYGHLVALRGGDLAYLHVHPDGTPGDGSAQPGPDVVFYAAVPSPGTYHFYLDFKHHGEVRTAAFTVAAGDTPLADAKSPSAKTPQAGGDDGHSGH
jgi:hypothetical protein